MTTTSLKPKSRTQSDPDWSQVARASESKNPTSETATLANREWYPGLCTTCVNESTCTFPRPTDRPVTTCDEFEGEVAVAKPVSAVRPDERERWALANRDWYPGLCAICEKREDCTYPKPEGGVFHCEEYE